MMRFTWCLNTTFFICVHLCPSVVKKSFTAWIRLRCCSTAGWEACATTLECRRVSRRIVARLQRLMATVAANPGRCPGLSCGGLSGLVFAPLFWKKEAMDFPLTERLSRDDSVKKNFNHRWTQINTDEETSERRSGPDFRRSLNDALYVVLEYHVFHLCPSVSICG